MRPDEDRLWRSCLVATQSLIRMDPIHRLTAMRVAIPCQHLRRAQDVIPAVVFVKFRTLTRVITSGIAVEHNLGITDKGCTVGLHLP